MKQDGGKKSRTAAYIMSLIIVAVMIAFIAHIIKKDPLSFASAVTSVCAVVVGIGVICIIGILQNRRESKTRELENIHTIMQQINAMVILWDSSFKYIQVNDLFTRITGYTAEDLLDPNIFVNVLPSDALDENLQALIDSRDKEFQIKTKSGDSVCTIWTTSMVSSISDSNGTSSVLMSIGPDLSEYNRMRQEVTRYSGKLLESEKRYKLSMELSDIGLLLKEKSSTLFYASDRLCGMLGINAGKEDYIESALLRARFHPADVGIFDSFAAGVLYNNADRMEFGETHSVDFRALSADGTYHWYNFRYRYPKAGTLTVGGALMDITVDKEKDLVIERMAYIDDVTGIYNRNKFMMTGNEILSQVRISDTLNYWVVVFDIDNFHIINDTCGYANGNHLLKSAAAVLLKNAPDGSVAARIGGDNFALLFRYDGTETLPVNVIKSIQAALADIDNHGLESQHITCSAGYCLMNDGDAEGDFAHVVDHAEFALSLSDGTRGSVLRFDNKAHDVIIKGNEIEKELSKAIDNNELVLYYQPKIDLNKGTVMGMEALIRWIKPDGTIVPPCDFIPVAERSLLITKISKFVLHEACRQNKEWQKKGLDPVTVSINLTAIDFYQTNVTESISEALKTTGLDPQWLDVELTESLALKDIDHAVEQMNEIKALGVKLSMDDFGTGYSSLSYIQVLPLNLLKLDRSFIMYLEEDEVSREIVSAVIRIAKSKKIETIAEGIETVEQSEILRQSGCDYAQGYFFGKPMPADKFEEFLRKKQAESNKNQAKAK